MNSSKPLALAPEPESASAAVFFGIIGALEGGRAVPGQRLVESDLAVQFGVGRNSVREALQRLAAEGIVEVTRHRGAAIRSLGVQETMDVLDVAELMNGLLARGAARGAASGKSRKQLSEAIARLEQADGRKDTEAFAKARRDYYRALLELSGSRELRRLFPSIQLPIVYAQYRLRGLQQLRLRDYQAVAKAVLAGRDAAAEEAGCRHVRNVRDAIFRALETPAADGRSQAAYGP
jgi:DNA-binding GntR family transcriptional regulator